MSNTWTAFRTRTRILEILTRDSSGTTVSVIMNSMASCPAAQLHNAISSLITSSAIIKSTNTKPAYYAINPAKTISGMLRNLWRQRHHTLTPISEPRGHYYRGAR